MQLHQRNVIVLGLGVIIWMRNHFFYSVSFYIEHGRLCQNPRKCRPLPRTVKRSGREEGLSISEPQTRSSWWMNFQHQKLEARHPERDDSPKTSQGDSGEGAWPPLLPHAPSTPTPRLSPRHHPSFWLLCHLRGICSTHHGADIPPWGFKAISSRTGPYFPLYAKAFPGT